MWKYKYRYKIELPHFVERVGKVLTGTIQVGKKLSKAEIYDLAYKMSHGRYPKGKLIEAKLIEVRY